MVGTLRRYPQASSFMAGFTIKIQFLEATWRVRHFLTFKFCSTLVFSTLSFVVYLRYSAIGYFEKYLTFGFLSVTSEGNFRPRMGHACRPATLENHSHQSSFSSSF